MYKIFGLIGILSLSGCYGDCKAVSNIGKIATSNYIEQQDKTKIITDQGYEFLVKGSIFSRIGSVIWRHDDCPNIIEIEDRAYAIYFN